MLWLFDYDAELLITGKSTTPRSLCLGLLDELSDGAKKNNFNQTSVSKLHQHLAFSQQCAKRLLLRVLLKAAPGAAGLLTGHVGSA